ncbi:MAG: sigma-70 family RNA polymerase sigma factor [Clostridia bacterium]|nr:sigma-70 family RNA polymerase sigma factor [Clostridia bacterium]
MGNQPKNNPTELIDHHETSGQESEIRSIVLDVKENDQDSFSRLLDMFEPLILSLVNQYGTDLSVEDKEELECEASLGLYNAALSYDCDQDEVGFGLYAKICIKNRLATACRVYRKRDKIRTVSIEGIDADEQERMLPGSRSDENPADSIIAEESLERLKYAINKLLSPYESRIWWMYVSGLSAKEIAARECAECNGLPDTRMIRSVNNALYRIRTKLKLSLSDRMDDSSHTT